MNMVKKFVKAADDASSGHHSEASYQSEDEEENGEGESGAAQVIDIDVQK